MSRRPTTDQVEPDLPITPMLDMSFQLLAFFIMTFHPTPTEGQIAVALPPAEGDHNAEVLKLQNEPPTKFVVQVAATDGGTIAGITIREDGDAGDRPLGTDASSLLKELKAITVADQRRRDVAAARGTQIPPPRITIECGDRLLQASVVQVFDVAVQAGFSNVATVPIDKSRR